MVVVDLNSDIDFGQKTFTKNRKGLANVYRTNCFLATNRLSTETSIRQVRATTQRQLSNKDFFMFRSVSVHGFCSDNISAESSGHRDMPAGNAIQALPLRYSRKRVTQHVGECERKSRLENIRGLRTDFNKQSSNTLRQRRLWHSTESRSLCFRFNNHRFMSVTVSMGEISQTQSRCQGTYTDGFKRLYTDVYPHYRWKSPRCKYPRRYCFRTRCHLCYGSRLSRLCSSFYLYQNPFNFCYKSQNQFRLPPSLLSQGREDNWSSMRPNDKAQRLLCFAGLSCHSSTDRLLRHRNRQKVYIPNEQFYSASLDNCSTLQMPLADRNLFQMDQTISANQDVLRNFRECREDSNLDCHQRLRSGRNRQERTQNRTEFGRNLANSQHCTFRESPYYTSTYEKCFAKPKSWVS